MPKKPTPMTRPWVAITKRNTSESYSNNDIYKSYGWRKNSKAHLRTHPLCAECERQGRVTAATESDHILPITQGGDVWDWDNRQPLCTPCHRSKSAKESHQNRKY